jgi:glutamyl-tRNA synthetase
LGDYSAQGLVPEAVRNYLCLLGWSPKDNREILSSDEIISLFDLPMVTRHNARFDMDKLQWMNGQYIMQMPLDRFVELCRPILEREKFISSEISGDYVRSVLSVVKEKIKLLSDLPVWTSYFFKDDFAFDPEAVEKTLKKAGATDRLKELKAKFEQTNPWTAVQLEADLKALAAEKGMKTGEFIHPCRVASSGRSVGPSLYHMLEVLGKKRVIERLGKAV